MRDTCMRAVVDAKDLREAVQFAKRFADAKSTLQVCGCILVQADRDGVTVMGNDMSVCGAVTIPAEVTAQGGVCIPARELTRVLKGSYSGGVTLSTSDRCVLYLDADAPEGPHQHLHGIPAEEFPRRGAPVGDDDITLSFAPDDLGRVVRFVGDVVTGKGGSREYERGVLLDPDGDVLTWVGTDGYRLRAAQLPPTASEGELASTDQVTIPLEALQGLGRVLDQVPAAELRIGDPALSLRAGPYTITCDRVPGNYPNWQRVLPSCREHTATVRRSELLQALKQVLPVVQADGKKVAVVPHDSHGIICLHAKSQVVGAAESAILAEFAGDFARRVGAIQGQWLAESLECSDADSLVITVKQGTGLNDGPYTIWGPLDGLPWSAALQMPMGLSADDPLPTPEDLDAARLQADELRAANDQPKPKRRRRSRTKELEARVQELEAANACLEAELAALRTTRADREPVADAAIA